MSYERLSSLKQLYIALWIHSQPYNWVQLQVQVSTILCFLQVKECEAYYMIVLCTCNILKNFNTLSMDR